MTAAPALKKAILAGLLVALAVALVGAVIGGLVAGAPGVVGALIGATLAASFLAITAASVLLAARLTVDDPGSPIFFAVILGSTLLKFVVFIVAVVLLRDLPILDPVVLFLTAIAAMVGGLVVDTVVVLRARIAYVGDPPARRTPDED